MTQQRPIDTSRLPEGVHATFTTHCHTCGATLSAIDGVLEQHRCRIVIS